MLPGIDGIAHKSSERRGSGLLIAYGALALPIVLAEMPVVAYLPALYAKEVALGLGTIALIFALARLWDGFSDIMIGRLSDRYFLKMGRRKTWVIFGSPFLAAAVWFLSNPDKDAGLVYLVGWLTLFYTAHTVVKVPYLSWSAELATGYEQRNRVVAFREAGTVIGQMVFAASPLLFLSADASIGEVVHLLSVITVVFILLFVLPLLWCVPDSKTPVESRPNLQADMRAVYSNKPMLLLMMASLLISIGSGIIGSSAVFLVDIGLNLPNKIFILIFIQQCACIVSVPLVVYFSNRCGKHRVFVASLVLMAIAYVAAIFIPAGNHKIAYGLWVLFGICLAGIVVAPLSMIADIVDYDTAKTGAYRPGVYFSCYNLVQKLGLSIGVAVAFGLLDGLGFDPKLSVYSDDLAFKIKLVGFGIAAVLCVPACLLIFYYPINKQYHRQLRAEIDRAEKVKRCRSKHSACPGENIKAENNSLPLTSI